MLELVGRYRVQERIGEGAMADVYRAYDPSIHRTLAIKVLKAEFRQNTEYSTRFLREAKAAGALNHPNIVTIYDVGEVDGYPYIVMELLDGEPLNDVLQQKSKLAPDEVMAIGIQLGNALSYAHGLGVVHRDIKPSNIMLLKDSVSIKILDFGIARMTEADGLLHEAESLKTQVGQVLGTPRYMSPEQALGKDIDGRADLFSVGVVLYEMISGKKAFGGASAATLALQIAQQDPEALSTLAPESPRGLQFIVNKLLAKRPERRFQDGGQLAEALRREQGVYDAVRAEADAKRRYLPLQVRTTLLVASITALVLLLSIGTVLNRQYQAMQRVALTSGSAVASFVANNAAVRAVDNASLPPSQRDWLPVQAFVKAASADPNVQQMLVVDADGVVRGASDPALVGRPYRAPAQEPVVQHTADETVTSSPGEKGVGGFRFVRPIVYAGRPFGKVDVTLSKAELQSAAGLSRLLLILLGLVTLGVVMAASYGVARLLADPIRRLKAALKDAAQGNLDFRISHHRKDEFGELFDLFNMLTGAVQERLESLEAFALDSTSTNAIAAVSPPRTKAMQVNTSGPFAPPERAIREPSASGLPEPRLPQSGLPKSGFPESGFPGSGLPESALVASGPMEPGLIVSQGAAIAPALSHETAAESSAAHPVSGEDDAGVLPSSAGSHFEPPSPEPNRHADAHARRPDLDDLSPDPAIDVDRTVIRSPISE